MELNEIYEGNPRIKLATGFDNNALIEFGKKHPMELGGYSLSYDRSPNYFSFLDQQSNKNFVFNLLNNDGSLGGTANFGIRNHYYEGSLIKAAYLSDLRLAPNLSFKTRVIWKKKYAELIKNYREIKQFDGTCFLYTAILSENLQAISSLTNNRHGIHYHHLNDYEFMAIFGVRPWCKLPFSKAINVRNATQADRNAIHQFLSKQHKQKLMGDFFCPGHAEDEFERREKLWENFKSENFIIAENKAGEIIGVVLPWSSVEGRKLMINQLNMAYKSLFSLLPLLGKKRIKSGQSLNLCYLTHFTINSDLSCEEQKSVANSLLNHAINVNKITKKHHIVFVKNEKGELNDFEKALFAIKNHGKLFQVLSPEQYQSMDFIKTRNREMNFELALA